MGRKGKWREEREGREKEGTNFIPSHAAFVMQLQVSVAVWEGLG